MSEDPVFIMWTIVDSAGRCESDGCNGARRAIVSSVLYLNSVENI